MADGSLPEVKAKHAGGRPPDYRDTFCKRIIELGRVGYSQARMAADIGVSKQTITDWAKRHPEFSDALARARTLSQAWWEQQAIDGLRDRDFNASIWDKSVKSMFREDYTDRTINEVVGKDDGAIEIKDSGSDARKVAFMLGRAMGRLDAKQNEKSES